MADHMHYVIQLLNQGQRPMADVERAAASAGMKDAKFATFGHAAGLTCAAAEISKGGMTQAAASSASMITRPALPLKPRVKMLESCSLQEMITY